MKSEHARGITPQQITARLIRAYADAIMTEQMGEGEAGAYDALLDAIAKTNGGDAEACCHMGAALLCIEEGLADAPFRLGGEDCDPRRTEIASRLELAKTGRLLR
jgi:hypothetical protein